mmetsp:Transcript_6369/g.18315  ORF Transcript_6369/g.18315 Transcript_6369/m.18315 type:complete len:983 (+) Transcript_6369:148-3096(+)
MTDALPPTEQKATEESFLTVEEAPKPSDTSFNGGTSVLPAAALDGAGARNHSVVPSVDPTVTIMKDPPTDNDVTEGPTDPFLPALKPNGKHLIDEPQPAETDPAKTGPVDPPVSLLNQQPPMSSTSSPAKAAPGGEAASAVDAESLQAVGFGETAAAAAAGSAPVLDQPLTDGPAAAPLAASAPAIGSRTKHSILPSAVDQLLKTETAPPAADTGSSTPADPTLAASAATEAAPRSDITAAFTFKRAPRKPRVAIPPLATAALAASASIAAPSDEPNASSAAAQTAIETSSVDVQPPAEVASGSSPAAFSEPTEASTDAEAADSSASVAVEDSQAAPAPAAEPKIAEPKTAPAGLDAAPAVEGAAHSEGTLDAIDTASHVAAADRATALPAGELTSAATDEAVNAAAGPTGNSATEAADTGATTSEVAEADSEPAAANAVAGTAATGTNTATVIAAPKGASVVAEELTANVGAVPAVTAVEYSGGKLDEANASTEGPDVVAKQELAAPATSAISAAAEGEKAPETTTPVVDITPPTAPKSNMAPAATTAAAAATTEAETTAEPDTEPEDVSADVQPDSAAAKEGFDAVAEEQSNAAPTDAPSEAETGFAEPATAASPQSEASPAEDSSTSTTTPAAAVASGAAVVAAGAGLTSKAPSAAAAASEDAEAPAQAAAPAPAEAGSEEAAKTAEPTETQRGEAAKADEPAEAEQEKVSEVVAPRTPVTPSPGLAAVGSSDSRPETPPAPVSNGLSPEGSASFAARIAALKAQTSSDLTSSPSLDDAAAQVTAGSVKARAESLKRSSESLTPTSSVPTTPKFKWQVASPERSRSISDAPPAVGEVVAESFQPADKLKGFWEEKSPAAVTSVPFFQRAAPSPGNEGRKWAVKLNAPLANGKVSDLSYFKNKEAPPPPPPAVYEHKIGEVTFTLEKLQEMSGADGIDPSQKELYLSDEDFEAAFASDKASYGAKPKWRQILLKKKVGLF